MSELGKKGLLLKAFLALAISLICVVASVSSITEFRADVAYDNGRDLSRTWRQGIPPSEWQNAVSFFQAASNLKPSNPIYSFEIAQAFRLCGTYWVDCGLEKKEALQRAAHHYTSSIESRQNFGLGLARLALTQRDLGLDPDVYTLTATNAINSDPYSPQVMFDMSELTLSRWDALSTLDSSLKIKLIENLNRSVNLPRAQMRSRTYDLIERFAVNDPDYYLWLVEQLLLTPEPDLKTAATILEFWVKWPQKLRPALMQELDTVLSDRRWTGQLVNLARQQKKLPLICSILPRDDFSRNLCQDSKTVGAFRN